jgi:hypothetical protein
MTGKRAEVYSTGPPDAAASLDALRSRTPFPRGAARRSSRLRSARRREAPEAISSPRAGAGERPRRPRTDLATDDPASRSTVMVFAVYRRLGTTMLPDDARERRSASFGRWLLVAFALALATGIALHVARSGVGVLCVPERAAAAGSGAIAAPTPFLRALARGAPAARPGGLRAALAEAPAAARVTAEELDTVATLAWIGALATPLVYALARRFVSAGWSLCAAGVVATSFLGPWFVPRGAPEVALATTCTLALVTLLTARSSGGWIAWLGAGASLGLAWSSASSVLACAPLALATLAAGACGVRRPGAWLRPAVALALAAAFAVAEAALTGTANPMRWLALGGTDFGGGAALAHAAWNHEPVLSLAVLAAGAAFFVRLALRPGAPAVDEREDVLVCAAFALPYALAACVFPTGGARLLLPLAPCAAVFAAWGLSYWAEVARPVARWSAPALALAPLAANAWFTAHLARAQRAPDTYARAAAWLRSDAELVRGHATVAIVPPFADGDVSRASETDAKGPWSPAYPWTQFRRSPDPAADPLGGVHAAWLALDGFAQGAERFVDRIDADYVVLVLLESERTRPDFGALRDALLRRAQLAARFSPEPGGDEREFPLGARAREAGEPWALRALRAEAAGPVVEIHRLRHDGSER